MEKPAGGARLQVAADIIGKGLFRFSHHERHDGFSHTLTIFTVSHGLASFKRSCSMSRPRASRCRTLTSLIPKAVAVPAQSRPSR